MVQTKSSRAEVKEREREIMRVRETAKEKKRQRMKIMRKTEEEKPDGGDKSALVWKVMTRGVKTIGLVVVLVKGRGGGRV